MKKDTGKEKAAISSIDSNDFFERLWEKSWIYIKTVVDAVHEPVLILDEDLRVMAANRPFYKTFMVKPRDTEGKIVYKLGNGQWNIPSLRKLLENILPKHTFFKGFEVVHEFPSIGHKVMILNARQIYFDDTNDPRQNSSIIFLAIEDVTEMMAVAKALAGHTNQMESRLAEQRTQFEIRINALEKEVRKLRK